MNKYTILIDQNIEEAIKLLTDNKIKILVVLDSNKYVLGTITDGDIRRGFIKKYTMNTTVDNIINTNPITCSNEDKDEIILNIMNINKIQQIPIVDSDKKLIKVVTYFELLENKNLSNKVIIMAGGLGKRLRPLTNDIPKPMLKLGDKPILEIIIDGLSKHGLTDIYLSVNYKAEIIKDYFGDGSKFGVSIKYIEEDKKLGTAGALGLMNEIPNESFLVMNSDLLTSVNYTSLFNEHKNNNSSATMCVKSYNIEIPYGVIGIENNEIISIDEKPKHNFYINTGIYVLEPEVFKYIQDNSFLDMPDLFKKCILGNKKTNSYLLKEYWKDIGQHNDFEEAQVDYFKFFN